ncbi:MAG: flagellar hook-associated protein FlgK [Gammaproteobacteria bacterium]
MASGGDMLGIGVTALLAFQRSLATTGHNIANVNTAGYNRQTVDLSANTPQFASNGFVGTGVQITGVNRIYSEFISNQVLGNNTAASRLSSYSQLTSQVDNLLANANTGLSAGLQNFFGATHDVANDPTSIPGRQTMLSQGQSLVDRFHSLDASLNDLSTGVTTQLNNEVTTINSLAQAIAKVNNDIVVATGMAGGQPPNDLLDKRDNLIQQLTQHVGVTVTRQDNGAKNIFIGNGQNLVAGNQAASLSISNNQYDPTQAEITLNTGSGSAVVSNSLSGGTIGGLLDFRDQVLNPTHNQLGRIAIGLAQTFNAQQRAGMALNGQLGQDFFTPPATRVLSSTNNTGSATVSAQISNVSALTADDYLLQYDGANYKLTNLTSSTTQTLGTAGPFTVAGLTINPTGAANAGDRFLIQPTRTAAGSLQTALTDPRQIAAAAPIASSAATTNTGTGAISAGVVTNITNAAFTTTAGALTPPVSIKFTSPTTYQIINTTSSAVLDTGTYTPGTGKNIFPSDNLALDYGYQVRITGAPATGDSFAVNYNTGGVGDNRNALALAAFQTKGVFDGGTVSYGQANGQLVAKVGTQANSAQNNLTAQTTLLQQAKSQQASLSGVNLDEEAANMLKFQQAYQAAAQVISIGSSLFNTLLGAVRGA